MHICKILYLADTACVVPGPQLTASGQWRQAYSNCCVFAEKEAIDQLVEENEQLHSKLSQLEVHKNENGDKLRRKQSERERMEQRLLQMKNVKAPYQDELDSLLQELQILNNTYVLKFRSLEYLDEELGKIRK